MTFGMRMALAFGALVLVLLAATFEHPPIVFQQQGYRGTGMDELDPAGRLADFAAKVPEAQPPASPDGQKAGEVYENVQVLRDLSDEQFTRVMAAITDWVAPEQGCAYCHDDDGNFALDNKYTKIVARRMLQMTRHINTDWKTHVADTGVTCYTCHRGQPVPSYVWFTDTDASTTRGMLGNRQGQNTPAPESGMSSLPSDPLTPYLASGGQIRVVGKAALPSHPGSGSSIKTTEETYGLMMHLSESLGVNCTYCHNSRSFSSWDQSNKPRLTAYRGIRMVRDLNSDFMAGLKPVWPANRLGPHGDFPKLDCSTCHQKQFKPLAGLGMLAANPELAVDDEAGLAPNAAASGGGAAPAGQPAPAGAETTPTDAAPAGTAPAEPPAAAPAEPPAAAPAPAEAPVPAPAAQPETTAPAPTPGAAEAPAPAAQPEVAAPPPALDQPAGSAPPPAAAQPPATTTP